MFLVNHCTEGTVCPAICALARCSDTLQHPSLRAYKHQLALLQAQLSQWQHKTKFARNQIRNLISSLMSSDPPHIRYSAQLALITLLTTPNAAHQTKAQPEKVQNRTPPSSPQPSAQDVYAALSVVQELEDRAVADTHKQVALLARVLRLRILVAAGMWADVCAAIQKGEAALGLSYEAASTPKPRKPAQSQAKGATQTQQPPAPEQMFIMFEDAFEAAMAVHLLMLSIVYYTHAGDAAEVSPRLSHLHALLDSDVLDRFPDGAIEVSSFIINTTAQHADYMRCVDRAPNGTVVGRASDTSTHSFPARIPCQQRFKAGRCRKKAQAKSLRRRGSDHLGCGGNSRDLM